MEVELQTSLGEGLVMATIILERNQELDGVMVPLPKKLADHLRGTLSSYQNYSMSKGYKRLNHLVDNAYNNRSAKDVNDDGSSSIPYTELVRIQSVFNNMTDKTPNNIEYILNGGKEMENYVNSEIKSRQKSVENILRNKKRMEHETDAAKVESEPTKPASTENGNLYIHESKKRKKRKKSKADGRMCAPIGGLWSFDTSFNSGDIYDM